MQRTKNAGRNFIFGIILKIYQIIMPFIMRTIMIYNIGIQYAGLNNLFTSILQVLNLAELGVGAAMIYAMYEPIAKGDNKKTCALLNLYKKSFRWIGLIILILGLLIVPFLKIFVFGSIPEGLNIYILYLMNLSVTVLSYWLYAYKNSLLFANQRTDVSSKVSIYTSTIQYCLQIIALIYFKNYYAYLAISIFVQILNNIWISKRVDKLYPQYKPDGEVETKTKKMIRKRVLGLITNKIGNTLLNSIDSIIISSYFGLTLLASYQNYYFIITALISLIYIVYQSCLAGIGNSLILENKRKNYNDFNTMYFIIIVINIFSCSCMLVLFQPFITLWVGEEYKLKFSLVLCLVIYFYIYELEQLLGTYKDAAGIWYEDRFRPIITAIFNIVLSLILAKIWGIQGVKVATIMCITLISLPWLINNVFKYIFEKNFKKEFYLNLVKYLVYSFVICYICYMTSTLIKFTGIVSFIIKTIVVVIESITLICLFFYKTKEFKKVINLIGKILKNR